MAIPRLLGKKFVCSHINPSIASAAIKQALDLLEKARLCCRVYSSAGNGVPIGSEVREKYFKVVFLDTGLCSRALGLSLHQLSTFSPMVLVNSGGIAEQVVGQLLRTIEPSYIEPALYCWHRDEPGSSAEIDYLIQHGSTVIPIEVKAGATGSLKSLHLFMGLKKLPIAVRINTETLSKTDVLVKDQKGEPIQYTLISIPFYLTGRIHQLLGDR